MPHQREKRDADVKRTVAQVLIVRNSNLLLCLNKSGEFNGLFTGIISECRGGETPEEAAVRGCSSAGLVLEASLLRKRAVLDMVEGSDISEEHEFVYSGSFSGEPRETRRMGFAWFALDAVPFSNMPEDDALWYPEVLSNEGLLRGRFEFTEDGMVRHSIETVDKL